MSDIHNEDLRADVNEHYQNPEYNEFEEGIPVVECNQNRRILLKNLPEALTRNAIKHNILGQYGEVVRMDIPESLANNGCQWVFATFKIFAEAERAVHELNNVKIDDHVIQAMFAHDKKQHNFEVAKDDDALAKTAMAGDKNILDHPESEENQSEERPPPITVAFDLPDDDIHEKVTDFFRKKPCLSYQSAKILETLKKLAEKSKGTFDPDTGVLVYNGEIFNDGSPMCCNCTRMALLRCEETGRYFCSIKCNKSLKNPVRKVEPPLKRNEIIFGEPIKVKDVVFISALINEKCVYVKRMEEDCKMMNDFLKATKRSQKLESCPEVGDLVLARFMDDLHRSKVLEVTDHSITIQLYDIGNTARVSFEDLFVMDRNCQRIPCVAHKVLLKDVNSGLINKRIIDFLDDLLQSKTSLTVTQVEGSHVVLVDRVAPVNVNEKVEAMAKVEDATNQAPTLNELDADIGLIPEGPNQRLFVVNSSLSRLDPGMIACISEENYRDFVQLYKAIDSYARNRTSTDFGISGNLEVFLAYCNGQWHRAIAVECSGDGAPLCLLLDVHSRQKIKVKDSIPMPFIFTSPPLMTEICKITGLEDEQEFQETIESLENSWIMADKVKYGQDGMCELTVKSLSKTANLKA